MKPFIVLTVFLVTGCSTAGGPLVTVPHPTETAAIDKMHVIEPVIITSVRHVSVPRNSWEAKAAGAATGALTGAIIGKDMMKHNVGYGVGGFLGWLGGGAFVDKYDTVSALEIVARRNDGLQVVVVQEMDGWVPWIGQQAQLVGNGKEYRITK